MFGRKGFGWYIKEFECEFLRNYGKILIRKENDGRYIREISYSRRRFRVG